MHFAALLSRPALRPAPRKRNRASGQVEGNFDAVGVFAGIIILAVFVLLIDRVLDVVEGRLIKWRPKASEERAT
ncbi:hypothetical protein N8E89_22615 (plasmid) [Phyllobacterium sp. A18/5-2]|nr:hypothetical protein [Phyllobacterium sp. A18/5-2]UXN66032.1 hypothetical protein N8E89_22615 [Phyllobacterium sp. A18/5-2]